MRHTWTRAALCLIVPAAGAGPTPGVDSPAEPPVEVAKTCLQPDPGGDLTPLDVRPTSRVILVPDGDTLRLTERRSVPLACIDASDPTFSPPLKMSRQDEQHRNLYVEPGTVEDRHEPPGADEQRFFRESSPNGAAVFTSSHAATPGV